MTDGIAPSAMPVTATHASAHASTHCRNCDAYLGDAPVKFCPQCGQDTLNHPPAFWEFVHEFITHYVALEGKLWKTLWLLFFKPAELTREYRAGRKLSYISPLRLYITASFLFFLVVKLAGLGNLTIDDRRDTAEGAKGAKSSLTISTHVDEKSRAEIEEVVSDFKNNPRDTNADVKFECGANEKVCQWLESRLAKKYRGKPVNDILATLHAGAMANVPYALFLLLPLFALLTKLIYINRGLYFGEHVVYALHVHAFTFFAMLLMALLPSAVQPVIAIAAMLYYLVAMQRFFGGRWWATLIRYGIVAIVYQFLLGIVAAFVLLFVIVS
jgi:Protein of unknown function (DUF3667)